MSDPTPAPGRAQLLRQLRERTGESLERCRAALEAAAGDVDVATAALRSQQAAATWFHGVIRADRSFALILELTGSPADAARPDIDACLEGALLVDDDAELPGALAHPAVRRFASVRVPAGRSGLCAIQVGEGHAAAVAVGASSAAIARSDEALESAQDFADRVATGNYRFARPADVPPAELAAWSERARGVELDERSLLRILALSGVPQVQVRLKYTFEDPEGAQLTLRRLDRGREAVTDSLRDVTTCFTPGTFAVMGRALSARLTPGALADFSDRVRRWGDAHGVATAFAAAGPTTGWHTLPADVPLDAALVVGIVVATGDATEVAVVDRKKCLAARATLQKLPAGAWADLASALPDPERALLLAATDALHVGAVGAVRADLVYGKKGSETGTLAMASAGGGDFLEYHKSGPTRDHRSKWPGVRGEVVATAPLGATAPATIEDDAAHAARIARLPKMGYHLVPSCDVEVPDLYR